MTETRSRVVSMCASCFNT